MLRKVLVANRGEIAVRIIRACRQAGIPTVAVYSDVDRSSLHVQLANEAYLLGPAPPLESYLNIDKIIEIAKASGADAIHPGYGFLAENHHFTERCEREGLIFVGATSEAIRLLGNKLESRETMIRAGIPVIPGMTSRVRDMGEFVRHASTIGYPVLVKAASGGGGKGMRVVRSQGELQQALETARRESKSAFGDDTVYIEKYIERPRHVEFQIVADASGNTVHLYERECSIQRRHQKIVEETPCTALDDRLRREMGEVAIEVARAAHYTNAGTVEFLLDQGGNYYFLEVNTRVQVEHPITEMTTGVDIVRLQLALAAGESLSMRQSNIAPRGHAIEARIYAEDPETDFMPSFGRVLFVREPAGPGVRNDSGIYAGCDVTMHYDPILAKLIVWDESREGARRRMISALEDYAILGIRTTIAFLRDVMDHPEFASGNTHTDFIKDHFSQWREAGDDSSNLDVALLSAAVYKVLNRAQPVADRTSASGPTSFDPWQAVGRWEIGSEKRSG
jgi:acetyl-CoA carboxylase biotin carboxylase subunit